MRTISTVVTLAILGAVLADLAGGNEFGDFRQKDREQFNEFKRSAGATAPEHPPVPRQVVTAREEALSIEDAVNKTAEFFKTRREAGDEEKVAAAATVAFARQLGGVKDAGIAEDECTIWLEGENGQAGIFIFKPMEESAANTDVEAPAGEVRAQDAPSVTVPARVGGRKAIVLEPFETDTGGDLKDPSPEEIVATMKQAGIDVTHVRGRDAGIETFSRLGEYDIVYVHTHCGLQKKKEMWMSGEHVTPEKTAEYAKKYGDSVFVGTSSRTEPTYSMNADFIRKIKPFQGSLVYVSGCNSSPTNKTPTSMAAALKERGASAYMGYDGFMLAKYATCHTDVEFFKYLILYGLTVKECLAKKPSGRYLFARPLSLARLRPAGNGDARVEIDKDKRIECLKAEHRRLQGELLVLNDKIQADPSSSKVPDWEKSMIQIRKRQAEIYQRVLALKG